ncbi:hypothetical protein Cob_v012055 [Colletotrichum orbiculare MAFF 240422]|uniref:Uncharacterized protein n=1 Tax=Colletotrichum orbiculare (strain 104-T / ATCC 96160 / CBS 514.97 / LARS 414 / MAFF 240422) TaxID=1213857 RepID=A0A484FAL1_COLOR|nr:hypothetical protein Cob_v012055 [Colletotrichum orbiculare MAFF 240422]
MSLTLIDYTYIANGMRLRRGNQPACSSIPPDYLDEDPIYLWQCAEKLRYNMLNVMIIHCATVRSGQSR